MAKRTITENYSTVRDLVKQIEEIRRMRSCVEEADVNSILDFFLEYPFDVFDANNNLRFEDSTANSMHSLITDFKKRLDDILLYEEGERMKKLNVVPDLDKNMN